MRIGLIGFGAVATSFASLLRETHPTIHVAALTTRVEAAAQRSVYACGDVSEFLAHDPEVVVEAAGADALRDLAPAVLTRGIDVIALSVAALATPSTEDRLREAAMIGGARLRIPSGAGGGLDAIKAAKFGGIDIVSHSIRKPPTALPVQDGNLSPDQSRIVFQGTAREAALAFPRNANLSVAVSYAGIGLDRTEVEIIAEPGRVSNSHLIRCLGAFGSLSVEIEAIAEAKNSSSSRLTAMSVVAAIDDQGASIVVC